LVENSFGFFENGIHVEKYLKMYNVDAFIVFLKIFKKNFVSCMFLVLKLQKISLGFFSLYFLFFFDVFVLFFLASEQLQNLISVIMSCVYSVAIDFIVAIKGR